MPDPISSAEQALLAIGLDPQEAMDIDKTMRKRTAKRDGRVCICGHGVGRHHETAGRQTCNPSAMKCPCRTFRSVLEVEDSRVFLRETLGPGKLHALSRGIAASFELGKKVSWTIDLICDRCKDEEKTVSPVPLSDSGYVANSPTAMTALLCHECRITLEP